MKKLFLTCLFSFIMLSFLQAQQTKIKGIIKDVESGKPLVGVEVKINNNTSVSDESGVFEINAPQGNAFLTIEQKGFEGYSQQLIISGTIMNLEAISLKPLSDESDKSGISEVVSSSLDFDDAVRDQNISGLLHSSGDVFTSTASYTLGAMYFKIRGYDGADFTTYMNGINVNDAENGRANYSDWGGLNDVMRNKESITGINSSPFSFGSLGGATNFITRAALQRKQTKLTYSFSDRTYNHRVMLTYSTGLMANNWAFTVSGSFRGGDNAYVKGVFYDAWAYFASAEKKINNHHSISLTIYGSPTTRGLQASSTQEAYDLTGSNYYNPNWGYQNGEVRNAKVKNFHEPMIILSHYWDIDKKTKLTSSLAYSFGYSGTTALNWFNSADPRPDYYRNLPSWQNYISSQSEQLTQTNIALITQAWKYNPNISQINWDNLYQVNYRANLNDSSARYIVEDRRVDEKKLCLNILLNKELSNNVKFDGGIEIRRYTGHHFKTISDLLGGNYWIDIDNFAYRDFGLNSVASQSDANNPNRFVKVGDTFGYDYDINNNTGLIWGQINVTSDKVDYFAALNLNATTFWRQGYMRNGYNVDNSYGNSDKYNFYDGGIKAGVTYKINGRNFITLNSQAMTRPPSVYNSFVSPRTRNDVTPNIKSDEVWTTDLSYILRTSVVKARITAYQTNFWDLNEITSFYNDDLGTYVNYIMTGIDKVHQGLEIGLEVKATTTISFTGVAAIGNYTYNSDPKATIIYDNHSQPDVNETVYIKNFHISGSPQTAGSVGISYRHPKYWFFNANFNYFGNNYADFNPERRTISAMPYPDPNDPRIPGILGETKFKDGFTLDASIGKSLIIKKTYLNINFSVTNLLNNTNLVTSGYEQLRYNFDDRSIDQFVPKIFYGLGRTFFLNIGIRI
ncbi:MAG: TonB-dependent receptor [Bacteroidota bacterium]